VGVIRPAIRLPARIDRDPLGGRSDARDVEIRLLTAQERSNGQPTLNARHGRCGSCTNNPLLLIADTHHIVSQQLVIIIGLADERDRDVAREQDALGPPIVIQNRSARQGREFICSRKRSQAQSCGRQRRQDAASGHCDGCRARSVAVIALESVA
jgi:hypothetical protein